MSITALSEFFRFRALEDDDEDDDDDDDDEEEDNVVLLLTESVDRDSDEDLEMGAVPDICEVLVEEDETFTVVLLPVMTTGLSFIVGVPLNLESCILPTLTAAESDLLRFKLLVEPDLLLNDFDDCEDDESDELCEEDGFVRSLPRSALRSDEGFDNDAR